MAVDFQFVAPGLMIFAVLLLVTYTSSTLAREWEDKTLERYKLARARTLGIVGGVTLAQLVLASIALALMLVAARFMGFQNAGSYLDAWAVVMMAGTSVVGVGLLIASFARSRDMATNLSTMAALPLGFLSGAFFAVPAIAVGNGNLWDMLPTTHAMAALRAVLNDGQSLADVASEMVAMALIGGLLFVAGATSFWARRMARPAA